MEIFVRIVEVGSLNAVSQELGISATMVGNYLKALERRLGARLINRTTRRQSLTEIGQVFYTECTHILSRIENAENDAMEMRSIPKGRLRVSAPITLGSHLLIPNINDYLSRHPNLEFELILNDRLVDLAHEGFDAAFRFGHLEDSGHVARPLKSLSRLICASPAYLSHCGTPERPDDLVEHNCLSFFYSRPERDWKFESSHQSINVNGQLTINNGSALLAAAIHGLGIALLPDYLAANDIAQGRLVRLFADEDFPRAPLQLVYLPDQLMTSKLRTFVDFVMERFG